jgi:hypothetical protein
MEESVRLLDEVLPRYGFSKENSFMVGRLVKNSFTDNPDTLSDQILNDARYDYLGRVDYVKLTDKLRRELSAYGKNADRIKWIEIQRRHLIDHQFLTNSARLLRSVAVEEQVSALEASVE